MSSLSSRNRILLAAELVFLLSLIVPSHAVTFKNPPIIPTSSDVLGLNTADLNGDGDPDLIYLDGQGYSNNAMHVLINNGNGTFTHKQDIALPTGLCCVITVADVTNDGKNDVIVQGSNYSFIAEVDVLVGNGDGTFKAPVASSFQGSNLGGYPSFTGLVGVGDINGDNKADLVLNDGANGALYLLLGDNSGKFTFSNAIQTYLRNSVYLVDLNGDHHLDIVATDLVGALFRVFLGNGDGTFRTGVDYLGQGGTGAFILADLDGDGHPDMLTQYYPGTLAIFKGNPDGTFGAITTLSGSAPYGGLGLADYNSDGILDLSFSTPTGIGVELGQSGLTFSAVRLSVSGRPVTPFAIPANPVVADFDRDGHADVAAPVEVGIAILLGKGDGTFASADFYDMGQTVGAAAVADFNGDTFPDIAVTLPAAQPRLLLGNRQGTFTLGQDPNSSYGSKTPDTNVEAVDFNGDGKVDLDMGTLERSGTSSGTQSIAFGSGDGKFSPPAVLNNASPLVADFNHDGHGDMISVSGATVNVLLGQSNKSFLPATTALRLATYVFGVGDLNKDGTLDLVLNFSDHLEIWLGKGDGTFSYSQLIDNYGLSFYPIVAITDIDGDGSADIVLGPIDDPLASQNFLTVMYGNSDGTFDAPAFYPLRHRYSQIMVADLDRDNKPDLVLSDGSGISIVMNLGGRAFDAEVYYVAGQSLSWLNVVDVNGDGFPDIVAANPGGTTVTVLLNQPNGTSPYGELVSGNLTMSPEPSNYGHAFNISLALAGKAPGDPIPTGSVSFSVDGQFLATAAVSNSKASYTAPAGLIPYPHTLVAAYEGDAHYGPRPFAALHNIKPPVYSTTTALTVSPGTVWTSQTVRMVATVASIPPVPSGVVTFMDGTRNLGAVSVDANGKAFFDTALLAKGSHSLTGKFQGFSETGFTGYNIPYVAAIFTASVSAPITVTVNAHATSTTLSSSTLSPTAGTVTTFTAKVTSSSGTPFGGATFYDGSSVLGTLGMQSDGSAIFSTASLGVGSHSITVAFNANGPFAGSVSSPVTVVVQSAAATAISTAVVMAAETDVAAKSTLLARVSAPAGSPAGTMTFLDDGAILGRTVIDESGLATLAVPAFNSGAHSLTASYDGDGAFAPAASPVLEELWPDTGPGFAMHLGASELHIDRGTSGPVEIRIEQISLSRQPVSLSCTGLPAPYACIFTPPRLAGGGVSILTVQSSTLARGFPVLTAFACVAVGFVAAGLLGDGRKRSAFLVLLLYLGFVGVNGCSSPSSTGKERVVVLTVQATSGSGEQSIIHSSQIVVTVRSD